MEKNYYWAGYQYTKGLMWGLPIGEVEDYIYSLKWTKIKEYFL
jgi:hypothetical protein